VDRFPNYTSELLSQIEQKHIDDERKRLSEKNSAMEQNIKTKRKLEEVKKFVEKRRKF
jgi:hypothetical protein